MESDFAGAANTSGLESDARHIHDDKPLSPDNIAIGVIIGRTAEFFDFFVYGLASILVFPRLVFSFEPNPVKAQLYAFLVFSLAFVARPVGSLVFMSVDRRYGRGVKLTVALFLLGGSTIALAFLPSYETAGTSSLALLMLFRLGQGFAWGGAWDGLASLLALNAAPEVRGRYAMVPQLGAPLGFALASVLFGYFYTTLPHEDFVSWGWRYPFFVAFAINVVALFARLRLVATREFGELLRQKELTAQPVGAVLGRHKKHVLLGAFVPLGSFALFHLVTIFPLAWIALVRGEQTGEMLAMQVVGAAFCTVAIVASGYVADRIGRRGHLMLCAILTALFSLSAPFLIDVGRTGQYSFLLSAFALMGFFFGQASGSIADNFSTRLRYTGSALTSDLAWLIGAGFAPAAAFYLATRFGIAFIGLYLLSGAICSAVALVIAGRSRTGESKSERM
ncbi:substrate transporter [Bradyrhizobium lupini HPC(L)]|uniref:Substrate transporter n=1 Tax=Bradyrhizobium lupini HPC(L) TaxID=1229491 RepID=A0ABN0HK60_RHILU|nr:substrate transporter [Bradyrhizobium lupini HPC(L)]